MRWNADDWPEIGAPAGRPVASHPKPGIATSEKPAAPAVSDDFTGPDLGPQWTWQANPNPDWHELDPERGLRLRCTPTASGDLRQIPNLLGQRLPSDRFRAVTTVRLIGAEARARAGLAVVGDSYAWIGLENLADGAVLVCRTAEVDEPERDTAPTTWVPLRANGTTMPVTIGVDVDPSGRCRFLAALAGEELRPVGKPFGATAGRWVGATLGLFAAIAAPGSGTAEFDSMRVTDGRESDHR
nr:hypothetical protein [Glycomyces sp. L485]